MRRDPPELGDLAAFARAKIHAFHVVEADQREHGLAVDDRARGEVVAFGRDLDVAELRVAREVDERDFARAKR